MVYTRSMTSKKSKNDLVEANNQTNSDLPFDLTSLIIQKLSLKDNIRVSIVSKTWHKACVSVRVQDPTPWVIFRPLDKYGYELYDPSLGKTHFCKFPELRGSKIRYSRDGWLLMHDSSRTKNFFFNPFTHERIQVTWSDMLCSRVIAFSCAPTSDKCVIFSVQYITKRCIIVIKTYHIAIKKETNLILPNQIPFGHGSFEHVVFSNQVFYCLTDTGCLGMFDISKNLWSFLPNQLPKHFETSQGFLMEYQEDIFLLYTHGFEKPTYLKLDLEKHIWKEKTRLPGLTFYLGFPSVVTTNRDLVSIPRLNRSTEDNVWIKPPINISDFVRILGSS